MPNPQGADPSLSTGKKLQTWAAWLVAWVPALAMLLWLNQYVMPLPYHDDWEFVSQYQHWTQGSFDLKELFRPINGQPLAVPKMIFFAALKWNNGDLSILPYLSWVMSVGVGIGLWWLSRSWRKDLAGKGWYLVLLWNLGIFSPAQEGTWFWNCTFHTYIPGFCLVAGVVVMLGGLPVWARLVLGGLASTVATFSFGAGFVVPWLLMLLIIAGMFGPNRRYRWSHLAAWALLAAGLAYLALFGFPESGGGGGLGDQLAKQAGRPLLVGAYWLVLLGNTLADAAPFEPVTFGMMAAGALLLLGAMATVKLVRRGEWSQALPWLVLVAWAGGNAALIAIVRLNNLLDTALAPRYATHMHFFVAGAVGLMAVGYWAKGQFGRLGLPAGAAALLVIQLFAWGDGQQMMEAQYRRMQQDRAVLSFVKIIEPQPGLIWAPVTPSDTVNVAKFMSAHGLIRGLKFMESLDPAKYRQGPPLPEKWGSWKLVHEESGVLIATGTCGSSKHLDVLPDLVVLTIPDEAGAERIVHLTKPLLPEDFERRIAARRLHPEHYFGWSFELPPGTPASVKAYGFYGEKYHLRLIPRAQPAAVGAALSKQ